MSQPADLRRVPQWLCKERRLGTRANAAVAWKRWRRLMALVGTITVLTIAAALAFFAAQDEPVSIHFYIAITLGIGATMMLGGALMGLVFLSSGTGHDHSIDSEDWP